MKASLSEQLAAIALQRAGFYNPAITLELYKRAGSATAIIDHQKDLKNIFPDTNKNLSSLTEKLPEAIERAKVELEYNAQHDIRTLTFFDDDYPERLRHCTDAPIVLFYRGSAVLNPKRAVAVVGTRHATTYGQDLTRRFVNELAALSPEVLIISGLAYGIDIAAHTAALESGLSTIAVMAHGLDYIYPYKHKAMAQRMLTQGGLLSEYTTQTNADKLNFVRRNRIVAGMSDACVIVESARHGGGLITTRIAADYNRDVFAFPGNVGSPSSEGCNMLIRNNGATLISSAADFVESMGWQTDAVGAKAREQGIQRQLFPDLSDEEKTIVNLLKERGDLASNIISTSTGIGISKLTSLLFALEMKGVVRALAGGTYHLLL